MRLIQNKLSIILATAVAGVSILASSVTAKAAEPVKTGLNGRYVLAGQVNDIFTFDEVPGRTWYSIVDQNGEKWVYTFDSKETCVPKMGQCVTMIMNNNGTETIYDDIIEDVLWARPDEVDVD